MMFMLRGCKRLVKRALNMNIKKLFLIGSFCLLAAGCATHMSSADEANIDPQYTQSSPEELYKIGNQYARKKNYDKAAGYYQASADQGYAKAQFALGYLYRTGRGVQRNYSVSADWFERAAGQGNSDAQYSLGVRYMLGQGTPQNYARALDWFQKAAAQGNPYAENQLGFMYASGRNGVARDYPSSIHWYQKAADQGLASAQYNLGLMYANGIGTPADPVKAKQLFQAAAASGFGPARKALGQS